MDTVIELNNLSRSYINKKENSKNLAVNNVNFKVEKGEVIGLLGPNGAGKSTIIKILTTLLAPTSGTAKVLGYDVLREHKKIRPNINFVYGGERNLYWRLTARENLNYFADLYNVNNSIKKSRIEELLNLVGLQNRADEKVETYSKGMKQKLQIAKGLINNPQILFLDEPTIGLDPVSARELRDIVKSLASRGTTILITTHYMEEADDVCDKIAIIKNGQIQALDTPENLKNNLHLLSNISLTLKKETLKYTDAIINQNFVIESSISKIDSERIELNIKCLNPYEHLGSIIYNLQDNEILRLAVETASLEDVYIHYVKDEQVNA